MTLDEQLDALEHGPRVQCTICQWLEGREDQADWQRNFNRTTRTAVALVRGLAAHGLTIGETAVRRHRRGHQ